MELLSANIIVCENVLTETPSVGGPVLSAVRILSAIRLPVGNDLARFFTLTYLSSQPGDFLKHTIRIQILDKGGSLVIQAEPYLFQFGYLLDPLGPGGYTLRTEFGLNVAARPLPLGLVVCAFLDDNTSGLCHGAYGSRFSTAPAEVLGWGMSRGKNGDQEEDRPFLYRELLRNQGGDS